MSVKSKISIISPKSANVQPMKTSKEILFKSKPYKQICKL